jgi:hypothetical protein
MNLRGVRESVLMWAPVFFVFLATHAVAILVAIGVHISDFGAVTERTQSQIELAHAELGLSGIAILFLRAFSVGAGTYTGIEAVSNGLPVLREPQVETGKRTMTLMGLSLGITVFGLLMAYMLVNVQPEDGKTLNAVLFESITSTWPAGLGSAFVMVSLLSATALLFIAAQAGFLDGPRVLANMAQDRWFPSRFATLSDRFVAQNGILLMGAAALAVVIATDGSVGTLVILYSINVFLTFSLSQLGMCVHWVKQRGAGWKHGLLINGLGLLVTSSILVALCTIKFFEGGWITLVATAVVVLLAVYVKRHYTRSFRKIRGLDDVLAGIERGETPTVTLPEPGAGRTAIVLCNGYNDLGVRTFFSIFRMFPRTFDRCIFVHIGAVDAGSFKGAAEIERLRESTDAQAAKYVELARRCGLAAEAAADISPDVYDAILGRLNGLLDEHAGAVVFAGQLSFQRETFWTRWLHNYIVFAMQRELCRRDVPFVIVPINVDRGEAACHSADHR